VQPVNTTSNMQSVTKEDKLCGYRNVPTERWVHTNCLITCIDQIYPYVTTYHYLYYMMKMSTNQVSHLVELDGH